MFTSTFINESLDSIPEFSDREFVTTLDNISSIIKDKLSNLNPGKATGPDGISPGVLKEAAAELYIPLSIIFKKSVKETTCRLESCKYYPYL